MPSTLIPLAPGCEELEAVTVIDLLRRAEFDVVTAGLVEGPVTASRRTVLVPDVLLVDMADQDFDLIALPGGMPGARHLAEDRVLERMLRRQHAREGWIGAICAAPRVLATHGLLTGRTVTSFPGALDEFQAGAFQRVSDPVVIDGHIVTSRGPGTAMDFALTLIECCAGHERRVAVEGPLQRP
jgi:protein deglycase